MAYESLLLRAMKHYSRDSDEDNKKWEKMKQEKAADAARNSHKEGWVPGGTAEKGHFVGEEGPYSPIRQPIQPPDCDQARNPPDAVPQTNCDGIAVSQTVANNDAENDHAFEKAVHSEYLSLLADEQHRAGDWQTRIEHAAHARLREEQNRQDPPRGPRTRRHARHHVKDRIAELGLVNDAQAVRPGRTEFIGWFDAWLADLDRDFRGQANADLLDQADSDIREDVDFGHETWLFGGIAWG